MSWQELAPILEGLAAASVLLPLVCGWRPWHTLAKRRQSKQLASKLDYSRIHQLEHEMDIEPTELDVFFCSLCRTESDRRSSKRMNALVLKASARLDAKLDDALSTYMADEQARWLKDLL